MKRSDDDCEYSYNLWTLTFSNTDLFIIRTNVLLCYYLVYCFNYNYNCSHFVN